MMTPRQPRPASGDSIREAQNKALKAWAERERTVIEPRIEARLRDGMKNTVLEECPCLHGYSNCYGGEFGPCPYCACPGCNSVEDSA